MINDQPADESRGLISGSVAVEEDLLFVRSIISRIFEGWRLLERSRKFWIYSDVNVKMLSQIIFVLLVMTGGADFLEIINDYGNENLVVTGVQFGKQNENLYIVLLRETLLADGAIHTNRETVLTRRVMMKSYTFNKFSEMHRFDVGEVTGKPGSVITDINFAISNGCPDDPHLALKVEFSKLNETSGKLDVLQTDQLSECHWNHLNQMNRVFNPKIQKVEELHRSSKDFITFRNFDAEGSTVYDPLSVFNSQLLKANPPAPLTGISLVYEVLPAVGGRLSLEILSLPSSSHQKSLEIISKKVKRNSDNFGFSSENDNTPGTTDSGFNPEYIYAPILVLLGISFICWFYRRVTDCICGLCDCLCCRRRAVVINHVTLC